MIERPAKSPFPRAVDAAIQDYQSGKNVEQARRWRAVQHGIDKTLKTLQKTLEDTPATHPIAPGLQSAIQQLEQLHHQARVEVLRHGPRQRRAQLYVQLMRAWTNVDGQHLGASQKGPLQRFLCEIAKRLHLELTGRGAQQAIAREQKRRAALILLTGSERLSSKIGMHLDDAGITIISPKAE